MSREGEMIHGFAFLCSRPGRGKPIVLPQTFSSSKRKSKEYLHHINERILKDKFVPIELVRVTVFVGEVVQE